MPWASCRGNYAARRGGPACQVVTNLDLRPRWDAVNPDIRSERPRIDKLGVKPESRVAVLGIRDQDFLEELMRRTPDVSTRRRKDCDLVFYLASGSADLAKLPALEGDIVRKGAIWVVSPRGDKRIQDVHVIDAAKQAGLVDNKVVRFSETHTALRLVVPLALR
jgi:hypothetical protein